MNSRKGMVYRIVKCGTFNSGIEMPPGLTFQKKQQAYNYGVGKWGSGALDTDGGWMIEEVQA